MHNVASTIRRRIGLSQLMACVVLLLVFGNVSAQQQSSAVVPLRLPSVAPPKNSGLQRAQLGVPQVSSGTPAVGPGPQLRRLPNPAQSASVGFGKPNVKQTFVAQSVQAVEADMALPLGTPGGIVDHGFPNVRQASASKKKEFDVNSVYPPVVGAWHHDFSPTPVPVESLNFNPNEERRPYDGKTPVDVQRPIVELGRPFYLNGMLPRSSTFFGETNLMLQHFYVYGDYRVGYGGGENAAGEFHNLAAQFRLDVDWMFTSTERIHAFLQPLNRGGDFTGVNFRDGDVELQEFLNVDFLTAFFEGDMGAIFGGFDNTSFPFDLPFSAGLVPLLYQNGIWMEDAVTGAAFAFPSLNNKYLKWSNYDITFFAAVDQVNSDAFLGDNSAAQLLGTAWFIEAYEGYIETGYAYVRDRQDQNRSYHNFTLSYARRYFWRLSNAVRVIANVGQDLPREQRTADGVLLLIENALISHNALKYVPYCNLFAGFRKPQSVARAGAAGGILRNTGINFESDNLNGFPTLDATANNTYGAAVGINLIGAEFENQLVLEAAYLGVMENDDDRIAQGEQIAGGVRYQMPLSFRTLIRMDAMYGYRESEEDVVGGRIEYRWKF